MTNIDLKPYSPFKKVGTRIVPKASETIDISNGITASYNTPVEQLTDGSFEQWEITGYTPDGFTIQSMGGTAIERSTDSQAGTYAALLTADVVFGGQYISDVLLNDATYDAGETIQIKAYGKRTVGTTANLVVIYEYVDGEDTYNYNFTGASAGTWTVAAEGPSADQIETLTLTDSYSQVTSTIATAPVGVTHGVVTMIVGATNSGDKAVIDDVEVLVDGSDTAVNGTFELWTAVEGLTNWTIGRFDGDETSVVKESSAVYSGTYAVKMTDIHNNYNYVSQLITGTAAETLTARHYARGAAGNAGTVYSVMFFLNNTMGSADQVWNKTTTSWEAYTDFGSLDDDNRIFLEVSVSEVYTPSQTVLTIPASTKVQMIIYQSATDSDDLMYVDLASETKVTSGYGPLATVNSTTGKITFDAEIASSDATADSSIVNLGQLKSTGVVLLDSTTVDMTATTTYDLYTATGNVMPLFITQRCATADTVSGPATWSIGTNSADYNNYVASGSSAMSVVGLSRFMSLVDNYPILADTNVVKLNVTTGSTATAHTVTWDVYGITL